jgi:hypothetical protein
MIIKNEFIDTPSLEEYTGAKIIFFKTREGIMKKITVIGLAVIVAFVLSSGVLNAQPRTGYGMGSVTQTIKIPKTLPKPANDEWVGKLKKVLSLEKLSEAQYEVDRGKYQVEMPYMMVIPQEENHIDLITKLFAAYGLPSDVKVPKVKETKSLTEAYGIARKLEEDLIPQYEWLIQIANDDTTLQVLDAILLETRMHYTMFDHALRMGWNRGRGMGSGMGRGGMM